MAHLENLFSLSSQRPRATWSGSQQCHRASSQGTAILMVQNLPSHSAEQSTSWCWGWSPLSLAGGEGASHPKHLPSVGSWTPQPRANPGLSHSAWTVSDGYLCPQRRGPFTCHLFHSEHKLNWCLLLFFQHWEGLFSSICYPSPGTF